MRVGLERCRKASRLRRRGVRGAARPALRGAYPQQRPSSRLLQKNIRYIFRLHVLVVPAMPPITSAKHALLYCAYSCVRLCVFEGLLSHRWNAESRKAPASTSRLERPSRPSEVVPAFQPTLHRSTLYFSSLCRTRVVEQYPSVQSLSHQFRGVFCARWLSSCL